MTPNEAFLRALGLDPATFQHRLGQTVSLTIGNEAARTFEGRVALLTASRLLARLFARVVLFGQCGPLLEEARAWGDGDISVGSTAQGDTLAIGDASSPAVVHIAAHGWRVVLRHEPIAISSQGDGNPVGAIVAACMGVAEVFKAVVLRSDSGIQLQLAGDLDFSTFDYRVGPSGASPSLPEQLDIDEVVQFGTGSVGSAVLYALKFIKRLRGTMLLVDDDSPPSKRNAGRYIDLVSEDLSGTWPNKVGWAATKVRDALPNIQVTPFRGTVREFTDARGDSPVRLAISAVDSVTSRRDIVDALPLRVINAGTGKTTVTISRHGFNDGMACLMCSHIGQTAADLGPISYYAQLTGLPEGRVFALLNQRQALVREDLNHMVRAGKLTAAATEQYEGGLFENLIKDGALYAAAQLNSQGQSQTVTLAFVSAFAGAMLAGEVLKETISTLRPNGQENWYRQDMLFVPNDITTAQQQDQTGKCLCHHYFRQRKHRGIHFART